MFNKYIYIIVGTLFALGLFVFTTYNPEINYLDITHIFQYMLGFIVLAIVLFLAMFFFDFEDNPHIIATPVFAYGIFYLLLFLFGETYHGKLIPISSYCYEKVDSEYKIKIHNNDLNMTFESLPGSYERVSYYVDKLKDPNRICYAKIDFFREKPKTDKEYPLIGPFANDWIVCPEKEFINNLGCKE